MIPEEKELLSWIRYCNKCGVFDDNHAKKLRRQIRSLIRAVRLQEREECAKKCDEQAAFYRRLREKGPGGMVDADLARAMGAEDCAAAIRERKP
jgi:sRNA-binding protein